MQLESQENNASNNARNNNVSFLINQSTFVIPRHML